MEFQPFQQGEYVTSIDERDDPDEVFVVLEPTVAHVSGAVVKIQPRDRPVYGGLYRLPRMLVLVEERYPGEREAQDAVSRGVWEEA